MSSISNFRRAYSCFSRDIDNRCPHRFWLLAVLLLLAAWSCKTPRQCQGCSPKSETTNSAENSEQQRPPFELAVPDRALLTVKGRIGSVLDDSGDASVKSLASRLLARLLDRRPAQLTELGPPENPAHESSDTNPSLEHLALDRPAYATIAEPPSPHIHHLLEAGGSLACPAMPDAGPVWRLLLPSEKPEKLAASMTDYCANEASGELCPIRTHVESLSGYVAVEIATDSMIEKSSSPEFSVPEAPVAQRFGLEKPTAALEAFADSDGAGAYATMEGVRRYRALQRFPKRCDAMLSRIHDLSSEVALPVESESFLYDPASESRYVDVAAVRRSASKKTSDNIVDVVLSSTDAAQPPADQKGPSLPVPIPDVEQPIARAVWPGPTNPADFVEFPEPLLGSYGYSFLNPVVLPLPVEAPGQWWRGALEQQLDDTQFDASSEDLRPPETLAFAFGRQQPNSDGMRRQIPLTGGLAAGWRSEAAPDALLEFVTRSMEQSGSNSRRGRMPLESRVREVDGHTYLLVAFNGDVDSMFGPLDDLEPHDPVVEFDFDQLEQLSLRGPNRALESFLDVWNRSVGDSKVTVTTGANEYGRTIAIQSGAPDDKPAGPKMSLLETTDHRPSAERSAWRGCRRKHVAILDEWLAQRQGREADRVRQASELLSTCAEEYPDRATTFRHAAASLPAGGGIAARSRYQFVRAAAQFDEACSDGFAPACEMRHEIGELGPWSHLPMAKVATGRNTQEAVDDKWGYVSTRLIRLARDGRAALKLEPYALSADEPTPLTGIDAAIDRLDRYVDEHFAQKESLRNQIFVAPDALAPVSALEPVLQFLRDHDHVRGRMVYFPMLKQRDDDQDVHHPYTMRIPTYLGMNLDEVPDDPETVLRVTRRGIGLELDGEAVSPPKRCGADATLFCLRNGHESIEGQFSSVEAAFESGESVDNSLASLVDAYPLAELAKALEREGSSPPKPFVRIELAPDVPVAVIPSLVRTDEMVGRFRSYELVMDEALSQ